MRVKQLKMQSFRGIGDLILDFDEKEPTVLVGINGVGKSSILDCLAILLSQVTGKLQNSPVSVRSFSKQDITNKGKDTYNEITVLLDRNEFTWSLTQIQNEEFRNLILSSLAELIETDQILNRSKSIDNDNDIVPIEELRDKLKASIKKMEDTFTVLPKEVQSVVDDLRSQIQANPKINIPLLVYYPVNRAVFNIPLKIANKLEFKQIDAYEKSLTGGRIDFRSFFEWFRNREDLENEERKNKFDYRDNQSEAVRQAIVSLIPEFSNLQVRRSPLRMTLQKNGEELIINQLSDGEKCLLAMVGDLARRLAIANPGLEDPLQGYGVVLIDEIELHLHPKWQRMIIPALTRTFPNCQFIVTTHSPQVISEVKTEGIYILKKTDNGVIVVRPESSYGRDSNQILEDLMDVPKRPQEFQDSLHHLFQLIEEGNLDGARQLSQQIADIMGESEPELIKARVSIKRKEILKR